MHLTDNSAGRTASSQHRFDGRIQEPCEGTELLVNRSLVTGRKQVFINSSDFVPSPLRKETALRSGALSLFRRPPVDRLFNLAKDLKSNVVKRGFVVRNR